MKTKIHIKITTSKQIWLRGTADQNLAQWQSRTIRISELIHDVGNREKILLIPQLILKCGKERIQKQYPT
jgi:hypothetical protein